jgi:hypothetical protein
MLEFPRVRTREIIATGEQCFETNPNLAISGGEEGSDSSGYIKKGSKSLEECSIRIL